MERLFRSKALSALLLTALIVVFSLGAWAQGAGDLNGTVTDPTGAVLAKVAVKATNDATGIMRTTETTSAGIFNFTALPSGTYTLSVTATGFRPVTVKGIVISVAASATRDIKMEVGGSTEVVNVEAGAEMVQTTESAVSQLIDSRVWQQMPLETRNQNSFINLVAGAVPDAQAGSTRGAAVNGARGGAGNYMVDGMDNNDQGQGGRGQLSGYDSGGAATSISPDAIQEYRVVTNSFNAEYGKAGGFVTDTVIKGGTNQWHGSLYEYNRIQALAAEGFFTKLAGGHDSLVRNQFGGSIGGPVIKDKTFFFFGTEYHKAREAGTLSTVNVTQDFINFVKSGQFATFMETSPAGACNNQAFLDYTFGPGVKTAAPCAGAFSHSRTTGSIFDNLAATQNFPLGTTPVGDTSEGFYTSADPTHGFSGIVYPYAVYGDVNVPNPYHLNEYRYSAKVDHKLSQNDQLSFLYLHQHAESGDLYGGGWGWGPPSINEGVSVNTGLTWNHTFTPTVMNVFKASYLRHRSDFPAPSNTIGIPQYYTLDDASFGFGMYAGLPQYFTDNQFQFQESLSVVRGKHTFKGGAEYRRTRNGSSFYNDTYGSFYPWSVEDLLTDLYFTDELEQAIGIPAADRVGSVQTASAAVVPSTGQRPVVYRGFRANEMAAYFQDDWRLSQRFTVNMGLRYEYFGPPHNFQPNIDSNFYFGTTITPFVQNPSVPGYVQNPYFPSNNPFYSGVATGTFQVRNASIWNKDTNNFAPRLGFSWDVLGNQKLVMRAGAGIMYDRIYNNLFENIRFNPPYFSDNTLGYTGGTPVGGLSTPGLLQVPFENNGLFAGGSAAKPNPRHMDQNLVSPYYEQFHYGLQYEFAKGYVFEPEYIGTMGHKLTAYRDINTFDGRTVRCTTPEGTVSCNERINTTINADNYRSNDYASNYHALQLTVRKSYSNGLQFNSSYTWSKALDTISDAFNSRGHTSVTDTMNVKNDYGPADFYMKHRFVTSLSYEVPFFKQNRWIGGWALNTIVSIQSGVPFTPYSNASTYDLNKDGILTDRVVPTGNPMASVTGPKYVNGRIMYYDPTQWVNYTCPSDVNQGQWCNPPNDRNSITGPGYWNTDLGVSKKFRITERFGMQLQGNAFNLFNHVNFGLPTYNRTSSSAGRITSAFPNRIMQLAIRLDF